MSGSERLWLCEACRCAVDEHSHERLGAGDEVDFATWKTRRQTHHASIRSLRSSVSSNCFICIQILGHVRDNQSTVFACSEIRIRDLGNCSYEMEIEVSSSGSDTLKRFYFAIVRSRESEELFQLANDSRAERDTGHENVAKLAHGWLTTCVRDHKTCQSNITPDWYPRRLLDIRLEHIILIETTQILLRSPYATLSHAWGGERFEVLDHTTADDFERGIPLSRFPRNFRDVIVTARRLGINYLWIDSFCIMQSLSPEDNDDDLRLDLNQMNLVYTNSVINFGATASSKPSEGCFVQRDMGPGPYRFRWKPSSEQPEEEYHMLPHGIHEWPDNTFYENTIFTRAWVLQERLLSCRMLHFTHRGIYWECNEINFADELLPLGTPQVISSALTPNPFSIGLHGPTIRNATSQEDKLLQFQSAWVRIRSAYTSMQLSYPKKDKFVALAGIAKEMGYAMGETEYIAGLFGKDLLSSLAWVRDSEMAGGRAKDWRAPSWSWASVDGRCWFNTLRGIQLATIKDWHLDLLDVDNKYGALRSASLTIKGKLTQAEFNYGKPRFGRPTLKIKDCETIGTTFDDDDESRDGMLILPLTATQYGSGSRDPPSSGGIDKRKAEIFAAWESLSVSGLVLQEVPGTAQCVYRRIGTFGCAAFTEAARDELLAAKDRDMTLI